MATHRGFTLVVLCVLCGNAYGSATLEERVERLFASGDTAAVINLLEHSDLESRSTPELMVTLGRLYREQGSIEGRLKSQKTLERAKAVYPHDPYVLLELGLTYFEQTFYPNACRQFRECIELDPDNCGAMYKLGVSEYEHWKLRVNAWLDDARDACEWLSAAVACDSTNVDAARRLTGALYGTKRVESALAGAEVFARRFPGEWCFPLFVGTVAYERGDMERADSAFAVGMGLMSPSERDAFTRIGRNTLGYADNDVYDALPKREQVAMNRGFWVNADPDPTTDLNERALEHICRTFQADVFFSASKPHVAWTQPQTRGWDTERGETLIKFGWPDTILASQSYWRWERWVYERDSESPTEFLFVDSFLNGRYQIPSRSSSLSFIRFAHRTTDYRPEWRELGGAMDLCAFREDNFTATIYASIDVGGDDLESRPGEAFTTRVRLFREDWEPEFTLERIMDPDDLSPMSAGDETYYGYIQRCEVPFESYRVAAAFEDGERSVHVLFLSRASTRRFMNNGVQLSDILLERESRAGPTIERGDNVLRPNPWSAYAPGQPLLTYVEIYDLAMRSGATHYVVRYSIQERAGESPSAWNRLGRILMNIVGQDDRSPIVRQSMERSGASRSDTAQLAIDVSALPEGQYEITIRAEDVIGGTSAEVSKPFYKVGVMTAGGH